MPARRREVKNMKQWLMRFFAAHIYTNLRAAADCSAAWETAATPETARKLVEQLLTK